MKVWEWYRFLENMHLKLYNILEYCLNEQFNRVKYVPCVCLENHIVTLHITGFKKQ